MNCISEILQSLRESRVRETVFVYKGAEYENRYGNYYRNHKPISKKEYHIARRGILSQKDTQGTIEYRLNLPYKEFAKKIEDFQEFIDELEYDKEYELPRETRGHLPRIDPYDEYERVAQIMEDTQMSKFEASQVNDILSRYTSTDSYTTFSDEEKELLDTYIDTSPIYSPPPVYRGLGFRKRLGDDSLSGYKLFLDLEEGSVISSENYSSFSSNLDVAVAFASTHGDYHVYIVNTKNLSGVSIDHLSSIDYNEDELIYKANTNMTVLKKLVKDNIVYLHVIESPIEEDSEEEIIKVPLQGSMFIEEGRNYARNHR